MGCTGVGVVMGCKVLDERVVVADCASAVPASVSKTHSSTPRVEEWFAMTGTVSVRGFLVDGGAHVLRQCAQPAGG
uniref:Uncharacterized protein n=1 Tax=Xanthomonas vasicola pv. vasculorum NCPPB 890 TaxID=1184265 RepID=A0A836P293_XANVA